MPNGEARLWRAHVVLLQTAVVLWLLATAAAAAAPGACYTARPGDTVGGVARLLGIEANELRRDNPNLGRALSAGQRLRVVNALRDLKEHELRWKRPLRARRGAVLRGYGTQRQRSGGRVPHTGVDIAAPLGSMIQAPATGIVRYCGPQEGFGTVLILEHAQGWSTVLAPIQPDTARCRPGEIVLRGDHLGCVASPQEGPQPYLHIELRHGLQAVHPDRLLR